MKKGVFLYFLMSLFIGTSVYTAQQNKVQLPDCINFYLNDFLIIPIVLTCCLLILRWSKNDTKYILPIGAILYSCVLYSVLFEIIFPRYLDRYTADFIDVLLYFASGILFWYLQKR